MTMRMSDAVRAERLKELLANLERAAKAVFAEGAVVATAGDVLTISWPGSTFRFEGPEALSSAFVFLTEEVERKLARLYDDMRALQRGSNILVQTAASVRGWRGEKPS